jgi:hypothetical protein
VAFDPSTFFRLRPPPVTILDARAKEVPLFDPGRMVGPRAASMGSDADALELARQSARSSIPRIAWAGFYLQVVLLIFAGGVFGSSIIYMLRSGQWRPLQLMTSSVSILIFFSLRSHLRLAHATRLRKGFLSSGCCASCGYSLRGLPPEADHCTVCPECGSAWLFDTGLAALEKALEEQSRKRKPKGADTH